MNSPMPLYIASESSPTLPAEPSLITVIGALALIILIMVTLAWLFRRFGMARRLNGGQHAFNVVSSQSLGGRERLVLVDVGDQRLVLGVTAAQINCLATQPRPAMPVEMASPSSFADIFSAIRQRHKPG